LASIQAERGTVLGWWAMEEAATNTSPAPTSDAMCHVLVSA
jgi:hypothetical protein